MKPRTKRGLAIAGGLASFGVAAHLVLQTFQSNLGFFFSPSQVYANEAPKNKLFRIVVWLKKVASFETLVA